MVSLLLSTTLQPTIIEPTRLSSWNYLRPLSSWPSSVEYHPTRLMEQDHDYHQHAMWLPSHLLVSITWGSHAGDYLFPSVTLTPREPAAFLHGLFSRVAFAPVYFRKASAARSASQHDGGRILFEIQIEYRPLFPSPRTGKGDYSYQLSDPRQTHLHNNRPTDYEAPGRPQQWPPPNKRR